MAMSYALANNLLDAYLNATSYSESADVWGSLHTADPGITGADECTGGSYGRQQIAFDAAANGATQNSAQEEWTNMPACSISYVGLWDAETVGNFLQGGGITGAPKTVNSGDTVRCAIGDLDVTLT